jgi:hypothetical protein
VTYLLRPATSGDSETDWREPWAAADKARRQVMGRLVTAAINADPVEVARLRKARAEAWSGWRYRRARGGEGGN